ncbi:MAG: Na+/H+ antiporter NhaA, partial [Bdellovibrionales bacterium]|nr:Na+/H+ antiporter NhaA [Bdellovibrionales bacterium]
MAASSKLDDYSPDRPILRISKPLARFLHVESNSGIFLMLCALAALGFANSTLAKEFAAFWKQTVVIGFADGFHLSYPLYYWVNDALMAIFFFVIGLEIKREITIGQLSTREQLALPVIAAVGGAMVPACIYLSLQFGQAGEAGWGVPMATDIAFVVGCLALLGSRVPRGLKMLLLALAIVDDILAVLIIALFYTEQLYFTWLAWSAAGFLFVVLLQRLDVRSVWIYSIVGAFSWVCMLKSGVHPTVTGVILGLMTPITALIDPEQLKKILEKSLKEIENSAGYKRRELINELEFLVSESVSPVERIESALHTWVAYVVMPIFALANAGVAISADGISSPVSTAIILGLFLGKPIGIVLSSWLAVKTKIAVLPEGVNW